MTATDSPRVTWTFAIALALSVALAVASFCLLPNSNLPIGLAAVAALLSLVELVCEVQEKRIKIATSRALMVKATRIFLALTPLLLVHILAPYAVPSNAAAGRSSRLAMHAFAGKPAATASEARLLELEATEAMLERRLRALEQRR